MRSGNPWNGSTNWVNNLPGIPQMRIDAHHHLWSYHPSEYGWMDESMGVLKRDYLPAELAGEMKKTGITGSVVVQARQSVEETRWLLEQAELNPFIKGVVGWFALSSGQLQDQLERFASHPRLVGARHVIHDEPDDDYMLQPAFLGGIERLQAHNLVFDLLLFPRHLSRALILARSFPGQRFVLDHMAKPRIRSGQLEPWQGDLEALASMPNVWCKVSGMVTEANRDQWRYEEFVPYLDVVFGAFGTHRIMVGSDWPVCRLAGEYAEVMGIPLRYTRGCNRHQLERIYGLNAAECYQLED